MQVGLLFFPSLLLSAACALTYGLYLQFKPESLLRALVKTGFMGGIALALVGGPPPLLIACIAAAIGDFFVGFEKRAWALPIGMIAFIIMHLGYVLNFVFLWMWSGEGDPMWVRYALMLLVVAALAIFLVVLWRDPSRKGNPLLAVAAIIGALTLGAFPLVFAAIGYAASFDDIGLWQPHELAAFWGVIILALVFMWLRRDLGLVKLAGMVYAAIIVQMAFMAFFLPWMAWPAMLGALLFIVSDGFLSWELFRLSPDAPARRFTGHAIWWTYVAAQILIVCGLTTAAFAMF